MIFFLVSFMKVIKMSEIKYMKYEYSKLRERLGFVSFLLVFALMFVFQSVYESFDYEIYIKMKNIIGVTLFINIIFCF